MMRAHMMINKMPHESRFVRQNKTKIPSDSIVASAQTPSFIRVFIADSQEIVRAGLRTFVSGEQDLRVVGEAARTDELLSEVQRARPDVVLLESRLVGESGAEICKMLVAAVPSIRIISIGWDHGTTTFDHAMVAETQGFLVRSVRQAELVKAIRLVANGSSYLCPEAAERTLHLLRQQQGGAGLRSGLQALSPRERHIIALIAEGHTNKEIAAKLVLSDRTVKNYIATMFSKLGVERRTQAVSLYLKAQSPSWELACLAS